MLTAAATTDHRPIATLYLPYSLAAPQVIVLFRFLHDKDVFESYYKAHLQKRLLGEWPFQRCCSSVPCERHTGQ